MILNTLAEAFQGDRIHPMPYRQKRHLLSKRKTSTWKLRQRESDTDLEETDVQEIPLAYKKTRVSCEQEKCAAMISLASHTLIASGENGMNGTHGLHAT